LLHVWDDVPDIHKGTNETLNKEIYRAQIVQALSSFPFWPNSSSSSSSSSGAADSGSLLQIITKFSFYLFSTVFTIVYFPQYE
jgi:hypothetical protein